ncbi:metal ABC transporter permease [Pseudomonadota bacterium]
MLEIFQYDFMIRAFIAGVIISVIAPMIGAYLVVRGYSMMADTLAHVSLTGVAIGLLTGGNPVATASLTAILSAVGIEKLRENKKIYSESSMAIFMSGSMAVAIVLISLAKGFNANLFSYLFGSISTVTTSDVYIIAALGILVLLTIFLVFKELFMVSFDEEVAWANGINSKLFNAIIIVMAAITVSLCMRIVGVLLVGALMVIPVITAMQFGKSFKKTMALAVLFSFISVISGLVVSYYVDVASGGTIVLIAIALFILSLIINRKG